MFNDFTCFDQSCSGQDTGLCGSVKMSQHFQNILKEAGGKTVQYFEHIEVNYTRGDLKKVEACPPPLFSMQS